MYRLTNNELKPFKKTGKIAILFNNISINASLSLANMKTIPSNLHFFAT